MKKVKIDKKTLYLFSQNLDNKRFEKTMKKEFEKRDKNKDNKYSK